MPVICDTVYSNPFAFGLSLGFKLFSQRIKNRKSAHIYIIQCKITVN